MGIQVPLATKPQPKWLAVRCHDWKGQAIDEGDEVADWLSDFLRQRVRLVRYAGIFCKFAVTDSALQLHVLLLAIQLLMRQLQVVQHAALHAVHMQVHTKDICVAS